MVRAEDGVEDSLRDGSVACGGRPIGAERGQRGELCCAERDDHLADRLRLAGGTVRGGVAVRVVDALQDVQDIAALRETTAGEQKRGSAKGAKAALRGGRRCHT